MILHQDTEQALVKEILLHTEVPLIVYNITPFHILYINSALEKEWGFYADIIMEDPNRITEIVDTEDRASFIEKVIDHPLGYAQAPVEFKMRMPDASQKWYGLRLYPLRIHNWIVGILENITEKKNREAALQATYDKREDYVRMLRHDLKGVIGNIEIIANMIREKITAEEQEELAPYFEMITLVCREVVSHTQELSDRFFLPPENLELEKEEVDLGEEIFQAVDLYRIQLEAKKLRMNVLLPENKMVVQADKMKFWQIIKNLISNAIKFSDVEGEITVTLKELNDVILLEVNDNGIGIPSSLHSYIFQEHSQAMRNGTKTEKSTGMGTYIIKKMVEAHEGEVWFESEEGKGTTFYVKLPKQAKLALQ